MLEPLVQNLGRELGQAGQALQGMARRDLFVLGGGNGKNDGTSEMILKILNVQSGPFTPGFIEMANWESRKKNEVTLGLNFKKK